MLLSTERKKVIENQFYFGYFLFPGFSPSHPPLSLVPHGWVRENPGEKVHRVLSFLREEGTINNLSYYKYWS